MIPFWRALPPAWAHEWAPLGVRLWADFFPVHQNQYRPWSWKGLKFENPIGLAGGVDKDGDLLEIWPQLGFGFVEIGTVTPRAQHPNPGKILDRDWEQKLLWNRMGFPSSGLSEVRARLETNDSKSTPLFVNIGKNRDTANEKAQEDYVELAEKLSPYADALVINVSSPNTQGLRSLQETDFLRDLVSRVVAVSQKPVLVKLSPDESETSLRKSFDAATGAGAQGFILTNTTLRRPEKNHFPEVGGVSGSFLKTFSLAALKTAQLHFKSGPKPLLVSVGGIMSTDDVKERLDLGADLVQIYSAMVFEGPGFPGRLLRELQSRESQIK